MKHIKILLLLLHAGAFCVCEGETRSNVTQSSTVSQPPQNGLCRVQNGLSYPSIVFPLITCNSCFTNMYSSNYFVFPPIIDRHNQSHLSIACKGTNENIDVCIERLIECCIAAETCCQQQLFLKNTKAEGYCPMTWDGFNCVNFTAPDTTQPLLCPKYVPNFLGDTLGYKKCTANGTWEISVSRNITWEPSHYRFCTKPHKERELMLNKIKLGFLCFSLLFLLISKSIFLYFKALRDQPRIRLHLNLFVALSAATLCAIVTLCSYEIGAYSSMHNSNSTATSILMTGGGEWCKVVTVANRYFEDATYFWVFCEALFLFRLLTNTFEPKTSILVYCLIGWGFPAVMKIIYCILRANLIIYENFNSRCWVEEPVLLEYLNKGPNLICLLVNIIFMANILRVMTNLAPQHDEAGAFKRSLRATFMLIPLFGLQCLLVTYQLKPSSPHYFVYSIVKSIVLGSHGFLVSLVFCIFNNEVITVMKRNCLRQKNLSICFNLHHKGNHNRHSNGSNHRVRSPSDCDGDSTHPPGYFKPSQQENKSRSESRYRASSGSNMGSFSVATATTHISQRNSSVELPNRRIGQDYNPEEIALVSCPRSEDDELEPFNVSSNQNAESYKLQQPINEEDEQDDIAILKSSSNIRSDDLDYQLRRPSHIHNLL